MKRRVRHKGGYQNLVVALLWPVVFVIVMWCVTPKETTSNKAQPSPKPQSTSGDLPFVPGAM